MNKNNIINLEYLTTRDITFLIDIDKGINVDKTGKCYYFKCFLINTDEICNFINNLEDNEIYLINPLISKNCRHWDPYLTLSRQFLVSNLSNPYVISNYLNNQLIQLEKDFNFEIAEDNYYIQNGLFCFLLF
uniref:Uncharacterized protein n=1 Tax=Russula subnigricans TaxID=258989 RepID=A0A649WI25_9AGAM|nr:hypothetical protein [Russula subnigricans]QGK88095.1 hypothetical protein [Russula subnigricans]